MTKYDADWAAAEEARRKWMAENGLYTEEEEHSSCGVGLVVSIDGKPSRKVVENGINALKAIWHRGAVDADGKIIDYNEAMHKLTGYTHREINSIESWLQHLFPEKRGGQHHGQCKYRQL